MAPCFCINRPMKDKPVQLWMLSLFLLHCLRLLLPLSWTCLRWWSKSLGTRLSAQAHTLRGELKKKKALQWRFFFLCTKWSPFIFIFVEGRAADCQFNLTSIIILPNWLLTRFEIKYVKKLACSIPPTCKVKPIKIFASPLKWQIYFFYIYICSMKEWNTLLHRWYEQTG